MSIRTVIADDEVLARQKLRKLLAVVPEVEVIGEAASATELLAVTQACRPDLLFVDISMSGVSGSEYANRLLNVNGTPGPLIVFSATPNASSAVIPKIEAVDYLLKPFTEERLMTAMQCVKEQMLIARPGCTSELPMCDTSYATRIVFKSKGRILFLPISDIRWIGAEENYVRVATTSEDHLLRETMHSIEQRLDPQWFLRVHRSAIVNLRYVREFRAGTHGDLAVHLIDGIKIAMSRNYYSHIREMFCGDHLDAKFTGALTTA